MPIRTFTNLDNYYNNDDQWGNHQYTTIKDVVNNFMFEQEDDSYVGSVNRNRVVYHAKRAVQELYFDVLNEVIAIEFDLTPTLIIPIPHDYVNYVRISWVDSNGKLHPLAVDNSSNLAQAYLQADTYEYLYDQDGGILQGSHLQDLGESTLGDQSYLAASGVSSPMPNFNTDASKVFKNGSYKVDKDRGVIQFSSTVSGRTIVLEYISDGLFQREDSDIRIHKFAEEAAYNFIYWKLISKKRNVPYNEKMRARQEFYNSRRVAKRRITPIRFEEIRQVMKSQNKMIKN